MLTLLKNSLPTRLAHQSYSALSSDTVSRAQGILSQKRAQQAIGVQNISARSDTVIGVQNISACSDTKTIYI